MMLHSLIKVKLTVLSCSVVYNYYENCFSNVVFLNNINIMDAIKHCPCAMVSSYILSRITAEM